MMQHTKSILLPVLALLLLAGVPSSSSLAKGGQAFLLAQSDGGADYRDNSGQVPPQQATPVGETRLPPAPGKTTSAEKPAGLGAQAQSRPIDGGFLLFGGLIGMCTGLGLLATRKRARRISEWARNHKKATWGILTVLHLALGTAGFLAGKGLQEMGLELGHTSTFTLMGVFGVAALLYPMKHATRGLFRKGFARQKLHDLVLALSGFMLLVAAGNKMGGDNIFTRMGVPVVSVTEIFTAVQDIPGHSEFTEGTNDVAQEPERKGASNAVKILLTVLSVIILAAALYLLAVLSCYIACSGAEALALVVAIGGLAILLFAFIMVMREIWGRKKPKPAAN
jgi:hypothetical protein